MPALSPRILRSVGMLLYCGLSACSVVFDAPSIDQVIDHRPEEVLREAAREQVEMVRREALQRATQSSIDAVSVGPDRGSGQGRAPAILAHAWPVLKVERVRSELAQLVLESPVQGEVLINGSALGLVQPGTVRVVTLTPGEHLVSIKAQQAPPLSASFYIERGERVVLRWEARP